MNKKIELTNTYVDCRSWSVEDKIKYMKLCIGNDLPHSKICGWASYSLDSLIDIYSKCTFIYFDGSMLSQDQRETPVLMSGRNLVSLDEILRAAALEEKTEGDFWAELESSINEEKPRIKVEYVKCEFSHAWEAVKAFEDGEGLYTKRSHKDYILIDNAPDVLRFLYDLHERIETPITEREAFVEALQELWIIDGVDGQEQMDKIVDSGKFKIANQDSDLLRSRIRAVAEWEMNTSNNHDWESVAESIYCAVDDLLKS